MGGNDKVKVTPTRCDAVGAMVKVAVINMTITAGFGKYSRFSLRSLHKIFFTYPMPLSSIYGTKPGMVNDCYYCWKKRFNKI